MNSSIDNCHVTLTRSIVSQALAVLLPISLSTMSSELYKDSTEWADITPVPQHEPDSNPIAPIFYTEACKYPSFTSRNARADHPSAQTRTRLTTSVVL